MFIDKTNKKLNTYQYSLVQFNNLWSKERINIGLILSDKLSSHCHIPKIDKQLEACLEFDEVAGLNYTLEILKDRIVNQKRVTYGEVSNSVFVTDSLSFRSELSIEEALEEAVEKFMMLKALRDTRRKISTNKYDKTTILKLINERAKALNIVNLVQRKQFGISKKLIDMALVDKNNNPYSVASVASIHRETFDNHLINGIFTLQEAMRHEQIKDQFLYLPVMKNLLTQKENLSLGWAKEQAQHINVDVVTDHREDAVLERLNQYKPTEDLKLS